MPSRALAICSFSGCDKLTRDKSRRCELHPKQAGWYKTNAGKTTTQRGYGYAWEKQKKLVMQRDMGLCQPCKRAGRFGPAEEVDHIVPKSQHASQAFDPSGADRLENLESTCKPCHKAKTKSESNAARKKAHG